jgi:hypothetical protein
VVLARITGTLPSRSREPLPPREPELRCGVVLGVAGAELRQMLERSSWGSAHRRDLAGQYGYHEALGAIALSVAAELIMTGEQERVLVLSGSGESFSAIVLGSGASSAE